MKTSIKQPRAILAVLVGLILVLSLTIPAYAVRHQTAVFYGPITLDGLNAPIGSVVTVTIDGLEWTCEAYGEKQYVYYNIVIPNNTGGADKNGGEYGDIVYFSVQINGITYFDSDTDVFIPGGSAVLHPIIVKSSSVNPIDITTERLEDGVTGCAYTAQFQAEGGVPPYTWQGQNIPAGLTLSTAGTLYGIPTSAGEFHNILVTAKGTGGQSQSEYFSIIIWEIGDADHSGSIDRDDVIFAMKIYLGLISYTPSADVNQDGVVDLQDAVLIQLLPGYTG